MNKLSLPLGVALVCLVSPFAQANVVITGTRVIYPADKREVIVKLSNADEQPALVQAWVDSGNPDDTAATANAPFVLLPPIVRMEPDANQSLRLSYTQEPLPADRESVFWLNILDIPPLPGADSANFMQLAYRSRIKLFFRPEGLRGDAAQSARGLRWSLVRQGEAYRLRASNPGAFHVSFLSLVLKAGTQSWEVDSSMVAPGESKDFVVKDLKGAPSGPLSVRYEWINDYGAPNAVASDLAP